MIKISIFFFLLCSLPCFLKGQRIVQADSIAFSGVVINAETTNPLPDVTCRYGQSATITDLSGRFHIYTVPGDTVRFTYIGFKPYTIIIPDTLFDKEYMLGIFMSPDTVHLSEAIILQRYGEIKRQNRVNLRNNMAGVLKGAYAPQDKMDADMNQRMVINEFARSIEMKGHVDVGLGVGISSFETLGNLKLQKKIEGQKIYLESGEIDLLKKLYYLEKREKQND